MNKQGTPRDTTVITTERPLSWPWRVGYVISQFVLVFVLLQGYTIFRRTFWQQSEADAFANALDIIRWQDALRLNVELDLQRWALERTWLIDIANAYYRNFKPVLYVCLILACLLAPVGYRYVRRVFVFTTLIALPMYALYPLAPPRFMEPYGYPFVDTLASFSGPANATEGIGAANQFAAMPSMHIGWTTVAALWLAVALPRWRLGAIIGGIHLLIMCYVVMVTGNHFILDIFAGWAVVALAWLITWALPNRLLWSARWDRLMDGLQRRRDPRQPAGAPRRAGATR